MSLEDLRRELLAMLIESENLPDSELSPVDGYDFKVKSGRVSEFKNKARDYYEQYYNHTLTDEEEKNIPYLQEVWELIAQNRVTSKNEHYHSLIEQISSANKDLVTRFEMLNRSLDSINNQYSKLQAKSEELSRSNLSDEEFQRQAEALKNEMSELSNNRMYVTRDIIKTKEEINNRFVETVKGELELLERNFTNARNTVKPEWAPNGAPILPNEIDEYKALLQLLKLNNSVDNNEKLVCVKGLFCINEKDLNKADILFSSTTLFSILNETRESYLNKSMLAQIEQAKERIRKNKYSDPSITTAQDGEQIDERDLPEYERLFELEKIIKRASDSKYPYVTNVWNMAYVNDSDRIKFEALMRASKTFQKSEPNAELIAKLEAYIDSLAAKITDYKGKYNLDIRQTDKLGESEDLKTESKVWVVLKEDLAECNRIINIINILRKQHGEYLHKTWDVAFIDTSKIAEFKKIANGTKYFESYIPKLVENDAEIANIKNRLAELIKKAKDNPGAPMADNGLVLKEDEEEYNLLNRQYTLLESAKAAAETETVAGVKVPKGKGPEYQANKEKITEQRQKSNPIKKSINEDKINAILARMQELIGYAKAADPSEIEEVAGYKVLHDDAKEFELLATLGSILKNADKSQNLVEVGDVKVDADEEKLYRETANLLSAIQEAKGVSMASSIKPPININFDDNKAEIANLNNMLKAIVAASYGDKVEELEYTSDKRVVNKDLLNEYELIKELISILNDSMTSTNISEHGSLKIDADYLERYKEIEELLNERKRELALIKERKAILDRAKTSKDLYEIDGLGIAVDSNDVDRYLDILDELADIKKERRKIEKAEKKAARKKIKNKKPLESLKDNGKYIKENFGKIVATGLCGAVAAVSLAGGIFSMGLAAAPIIPLANFGLFAGGSALAYKIFNRKDKSRLPDVKHKKTVQKVAIEDTPRNINTQTELAMMKSNFDAFRASDEVAREITEDASLTPENQELQEAAIEAQENVLNRYNDLKEMLDSYNRQNAPLSVVIPEEDLIETLEDMGATGDEEEEDLSQDEFDIKKETTEDLINLLKQFEEDLAKDPDDEDALLFANKIKEELKRRGISVNLAPSTSNKTSSKPKDITKEETDDLVFEMELNDLVLKKDPNSDVKTRQDEIIKELTRRGVLTPPVQKTGTSGSTIEGNDSNDILSQEEIDKLFAQNRPPEPPAQIKLPAGPSLDNIPTENQEKLNYLRAKEQEFKYHLNRLNADKAYASPELKVFYDDEISIAQSQLQDIQAEIRELETKANIASVFDAQDLINKSGLAHKKGHDLLTQSEIDRLFANSGQGLQPAESQPPVPAPAPAPAKGGALTQEEIERLMSGNAKNANLAPAPVLLPAEPTFDNVPSTDAEKLEYLEKKEQEFIDYLDALDDEIAYASPEAKPLYEEPIRMGTAKYRKILSMISELEAQQAFGSHEEEAPKPANNGQENESKPGFPIFPDMPKLTPNYSSFRLLHTEEAIEDDQKCLDELKKYRDELLAMSNRFTSPSPGKTSLKHRLGNAEKLVARYEEIIREHEQALAVQLPPEPEVITTLPDDLHERLKVLEDNRIKLIKYRDALSQIPNQEGLIADTNDTILALDETIERTNEAIKNQEIQAQAEMDASKYKEVSTEGLLALLNQLKNNGNIPGTDEVIAEVESELLSRNVDLGSSELLPPGTNLGEALNTLYSQADEIETKKQKQTELEEQAKAAFERGDTAEYDRILQEMANLDFGDSELKL